VEARRLGIEREEMLASISVHWQRLSRKSEAAHKAANGGRQEK
jgi:hypothetical protein